MTALIETERLLMRKFELADAPAVLEFSSHPEVTRYTGDAGVVQSLEDAEKVIREIWLAEYEQYGYARYALVHKADNKVIGFCGLKYEPELKGPDLGYRMLPEYWGQGLGTEAVQAALHYGVHTLGLKHIQAMAMLDNAASNRVLTKLGFVLSGVIESHGFEVNHYDYRL